MSEREFRLGVGGVQWREKPRSGYLSPSEREKEAWAPVAGEFLATASAADLVVIATVMGWQNPHAAKVVEQKSLIEHLQWDCRRVNNLLITVRDALQFEVDRPAPKRGEKVRRASDACQSIILAHLTDSVDEVSA